MACITIQISLQIIIELILLNYDGHVSSSANVTAMPIIDHVNDFTNSISSTPCASYPPELYCNVL